MYLVVHFTPLIYKTSFLPPQTIENHSFNPPWGGFAFRFADLDSGFVIVVLIELLMCTNKQVGPACKWRRMEVAKPSFTAAMVMGLR